MEEIFEGFFRLVWSFLKSILFDLIIDIGVRGPGFLIVKFLWPFNWNRKIDMDSISVTLVGILFWVIFIVGFIFLTPPN